MTLTAPNREGTYVGFWRLADQYGHVFGSTLDLEIVVENAALTPAPAATPTSTLTSLGAPAIVGAPTAAAPAVAAPTTSTPGPTATPTP